jgi:hypothetical protein
MAYRALFDGLVYDDQDRAVKSSLVGEEAFYVVDDAGFERHVESEFVDRQVLEHFQDLIEGNEELISEGTMKMIGQEDIFTKAAIEASLENVEPQFDALFQAGIPEETREFLGMVGFRIIINLHGEVLSVEQPGMPEDPEP